MSRVARNPPRCLVFPEDAQARAGKIKGFTGIDDPYEVPENPEMEIDTQELSPELAAHRIIVKLESLGFIR